MKNLLLFLTIIYPAAFGSNLIDKTCSQTPYYKLCMKSLLSHAQGKDVNVKDLATIMVYTIEAKATRTLHYINELLEHSSSSLGHKEQEGLKNCGERYSVIIKGDVPQALQALNRGDYKFAQDGSFDAATEAMSCEDEFSSTKLSSPISEMNSLVHDVSLVAASIVQIML